MGLGKGQANVLGAMLLLTIVITLWCVVWMWVFPILEDLSKVLIKPRLSELLVEDLIIEDVWVRDTQCTIYIYNIGEVEVTVSAIYINHILVWKGELLIGIGEGVSITVNMPQGQTMVKSLKVVTVRGGEYYWRG